MKKNTGLDVFPLVDMGCTHLMALPCDLSLLIPSIPEKLLRLKPYDPQKAYEKIKVFLGK